MSFAITKKLYKPLYVILLNHSINKTYSMQCTMKKEKNI